MAERLSSPDQREVVYDALRVRSAQQISREQFTGCVDAVVPVLGSIIFETPESVFVGRCNDSGSRHFLFCFNRNDYFAELVLRDKEDPNDQLVFIASRAGRNESDFYVTMEQQGVLPGQYIEGTPGIDYMVIDLSPEALAFLEGTMDVIQEGDISLIRRYPTQIVKAQQTLCLASGEDERWFNGRTNHLDASYGIFSHPNPHRDVGYHGEYARRFFREIYGVVKSTDKILFGSGS